MKFEKKIYETKNISLVANFDWITDDIAKASSIKLNLFAFDRISYTEIFNETLDINNIRELYAHLDSISILRDSSLTESGAFVETSIKSLVKFITSTEKIDDWIASLVLDKISSETILRSLSTLKLENLSAGHKQEHYKSELKRLRFILFLEKKGSLLSKISSFPFIEKYKAGQAEKVLQNWVEANLWVFWVEYERMESFRKISTLSEGDLVMKSIDWYLDLIELKKSKYELLTFDKSHKCYHWRKELNIVIWQSMHYIKWLQDYSSVLSEKDDVKVLRPRVKIIAWRSNKFNEQQFDTLRMINSHLVDISVITYDELIKYWNKIISHYN